VFRAKLFTMPNMSTDSLFQLIHSLEKSEKRNFKLYIKRNSSKNDLKIITLFDALDKQQSYDETALIKKNPSLSKQQLANLKSYLYKQILISLRLLQSNSNPEMQFHEQMDNARILYKKGLYHQSLRILANLKDASRKFKQEPDLIQILNEEKKIESLHITRSLENRAAELSCEINKSLEDYGRETMLSNLSLQLYGWYIKNGIARNECDENEVKAFLKNHLSVNSFQPEGFYEKMYYAQSLSWYAYIRQDFLMYYRYTRKWVDIFSEYPEMLEIETGNYIKGMHNLLNAHFNLRNFSGFAETLKEFEDFNNSEFVTHNDNIRMQMFVYLYTAKINKHFLEGTFDEGLTMIPTITKRLDEYELFLDKHRTLVFYYKIASLYFGAGDYGNTINFLNKIINWKVNLRSDLQCYARLLHLIAHYELANYSLLEYLIKSVYRFMAKMQNLSKVEEAMFAFLRRAFKVSPREIQPELEKLLTELRTMESNKFETRAFAYLDIISWLESKVNHQPIDTIIRTKFLENRRF